MITVAETAENLVHLGYCLQNLQLHRMTTTTTTKTVIEIINSVTEALCGQ